MTSQIDDIIAGMKRATEDGETDSDKTNKARQEKLAIDVVRLILNQCADSTDGIWTNQDAMLAIISAFSTIIYYQGRELSPMAFMDYMGAVMAATLDTTLKAYKKDHQR